MDTFGRKQLCPAREYKTATSPPNSIVNKIHKCINNKIAALDGEKLPPDHDHGIKIDMNSVQYDQKAYLKIKSVQEATQDKSGNDTVCSRWDIVELSKNM